MIQICLFMKHRKVAQEAQCDGGGGGTSRSLHKRAGVGVRLRWLSAGSSPTISQLPLCSFHSCQVAPILPHGRRVSPISHIQTCFMPSFIDNMNTKAHGDKSSPLPQPATPPPKSGCWDWTPRGQIFFQKPPHTCVQNDQRDEGIILRYLCWGTRDPPSGRPPPPPPLPPPGPKSLGGVVGV